jgi:hypothetical protein
MSGRTRSVQKWIVCCGCQVSSLSSFIKFLLINGFFGKIDEYRSTSIQGASEIRVAGTGWFVWFDSMKNHNQ